MNFRNAAVLRFGTVKTCLAEDRDFFSGLNDTYTYTLSRCPPIINVSPARLSFDAVKRLHFKSCEQSIHSDYRKRGLAAIVTPVSTDTYSYCLTRIIMYAYYIAMLLLHLLCNYT